MADLVPTELLRQYQQASAGGARDIMSSAMQMAGNYLQGLKTMAGGQAGVPMKTMARQESDANIASTQQSIENAKRTLALNELQKYADLAGKTPDLVTINSLGLGGTFAPIADQTTSEADLNKQKLEVSLINATKSGKSGSGGGGANDDKIKPLTVTQRKTMRDDYTSSVIETRKRPVDARAQLQRDEAALKSNGMTDGDILSLYNYIDKWDSDYLSMKRTQQYGKFYKPMVAKK